MKRIPLPNRAIAMPLLGLMVVWLFSMASQLVGMLYEVGTSSAHPSVWVFLVGLLLGGVSALFGRTWAIRAEATASAPLARAAVRFGNLSLTISLGALTIFAFTTFISGFNDYNRSGTVLDRLLWLYLPIIVASAAVVILILRALVFAKDHSVDSNEKTRMTELQKALALGYAVPIVCTAFAVILGLFIYDATRTNLQTWVWVVIIAIVGFGVIAGTRFASKARSARTEAPKPRTALAAGASTLNFVLSIVFGAVVSILAFGLGSEAMSKLRMNAYPMGYDQYTPLSNGEATKIVDAMAPSWFFGDLVPAKLLLLLAVVGIYLSITERNRERKESK
ncbi:MAG: hypothetical protein ACKOWJ_05920 [Micrococcales bacterium]